MTPARPPFRLAVVQPLTFTDGEERNVERAVEHLRDAAQEGAALAVFPEAYPGPQRAGEFDAAPALARAARETGCAVCWSRVEPLAGGSGQVVAYLVGGDGETVARYPRTHPATGDVHPVLNGRPILPGEELCVADLAGVRVGLMVCSEVWLPEVARVLALRGAELLLAPAGGWFGAVGEAWRLMARARALENECYVALTQNRLGPRARREDGQALIAGPEGDVAGPSAGELLVADLDLDRLEWLRSQDDSMAEPRPFRALPGLLRARRPELYADISAPQPGLYDYRAAAAREAEAIT